MPGSTQLSSVHLNAPADRGPARPRQECTSDAPGGGGEPLTAFWPAVLGQGDPFTAEKEQRFLQSQVPKFLR